MQRRESQFERTGPPREDDLFTFPGGISFSLSGIDSLKDEGRVAIGSGYFRDGTFPVWLSSYRSALTHAVKINGRWFGVIPNAETLLHRLNAAGEPQWVAHWGFPVTRNASGVSNTIAGVDTDGTNVFAAGTRCGPILGHWRDAWCVAAYNDYGQQLWRYDLGADATCLVYLAGQVVVGHVPTWNVSEPITVRVPAGSSGVSIIDPLFTYIASSDSAVSLLVDRLATITGLDGRIAVTGSSWSSGVTLTYDPSLAGPDGRRGLPQITSTNPMVWSPLTTAGNFSVLDASTGNLLSTSIVGLSVDGLGRNPATPTAMIRVGSQAIAALAVPYPNVGSASAVTVLAKPLTGQTFQPGGETLSSAAKGLAAYGTQFIRHFGSTIGLYDANCVRLDANSLPQFDSISIPPIGVVTAFAAAFGFPTFGYYATRVSGVNLRRLAIARRQLPASQVIGPPAGYPAGIDFPSNSTLRDFLVLANGQIITLGTFGSDGDLVRSYQAGGGAYSQAWSYRNAGVDDAVNRLNAYSACEMADGGVLVGCTHLSLPYLGVNTALAEPGNLYLSGPRLREEDA